MEADMLVCTVGEVRVWPGASNVIPGNTQLSIDIRSKDDVLRSLVVANVTSSIEAACAARGVSCSLKRVHDAEAVLCDDGIIKVCGGGRRLYCLALPFTRLRLCSCLAEICEFHRSFKRDTQQHATAW